MRNKPELSDANWLREFARRAESTVVDIDTLERQYGADEIARLRSIADRIEPANSPIAEATIEQNGSSFRIAVYGCHAATDGTQERALLESIVDWASGVEGERCSRLADDAYSDMMAELGVDE